MRNNQEVGLTTITGVIIPAEWDRDGNITGVAISTHDEDEYLVLKHAQGSDLLRWVRKEVEVTGWAELDRGKKTITVKHYRLRRRQL